MRPPFAQHDERARIDAELARQRRLDRYLPVIIGAITTSVMLRAVTALLPFILERMR